MSSPKHSSSPDSQVSKNTDRELWRERQGDEYADSIHVTAQGGIGINCHGYVYVKTLSQWHRLAQQKNQNDMVYPGRTETALRRVRDLIESYNDDARTAVSVLSEIELAVETGLSTETLFLPKPAAPAAPQPRKAPPRDDRQLCTPRNPMPKGSKGRWRHANAHEVHGSQQDGWPSGDTIRVRCDDCGYEWTEELPQ